MRRLLGLISLVLVLAACSTEGVPKGKLVLSVSGLPEGTPTIVIKGPTEVTANGPGTYELPVGTYALEARDVVLPSGERYYAEQVTTPVQVKRNQETRAEVVYALDQNSLPGELALVVEGLPEGAEAAVSVENPDRGVKVAVKASTVLRLQAGTYLVKASRVSHGGMDYVPSPAQGSVVLEPGKRASYTVSYGPAKGELLVRIEGLPDGLSARVEVKNGQGSVVAALAESRVLSLAPGTYFVAAKDVVAQDGTTYRGSVSGSPATVRAGERAEVAVSYNALPKPSFSLSLSPASLTAQQGGSAQTTLTLTPKNGFTGTVFLSLEASGGGPVSGIALSPQSLQVAGSDPVNQTLTLAVAPSVAPGTYTLQVKATSGSLSAQAALTLTVPAPTFSFALSPASVNVKQGETATLVASLQSQNGFSGEVSFSLVSPPAGFTLSGGPYRLESGEAVDVPLFLQVDPSVEPGSYSLVVQAESGSLTKKATLQVQVASRTGRLAVGIFFQGAPAGAQGYVVVSGPGGTYTLTQSQVLSLAPGIYTITAYSVSVDGVPYDPSPPGGTVEVVAGGQASFTVTYTPRSGGGAP